MEKNNFIIKSPRATVEVHLPDGRVIEGARGQKLESFLKTLPEWKDSPYLGAIVNGELRELTFPVQIDVIARPLSQQDSDGARFYRRSLTFLLEAAFESVFPKGTKINVDHSISSGGYFCKVVGRDPLSHEEISKIKNKMREMVNEDLPFQRQIVSLEEAKALFEEKGYLDKLQLLEYRKKEYLVLYQLGQHRDYHHGYMVPSTGYLQLFDLKPMGNGFALQFPRRHKPNELLPIPESRSLLSTFQQYGNWLDRLEISNVGSLNKAVERGRIQEIVLITEALHEQRISDIAGRIIEQQKKKRIVLIAGPSSSGKTTFSKRLAVQLLAQGAEPFALEMDNYFLDRDDTPLDENGEYDFESIRAVKTDLLSQQILDLLDGKLVDIPHFNFPKGKSEKGESVRLSPNHIIILEGIHGLNPKLLPVVPAEKTFRIYASCLTQINLDRHNRISTTDTRMIRRIVRDATERGYRALDTIQRWDSVRRGEKRHIFPYQENADELFNSALPYELAALKPLAEPLLRQVPFGTPEYIEAKRLLAFLDWFAEMDVNLIPDNSLLREFIGGSILKDFKIFKKH